MNQYLRMRATAVNRHLMDHQSTRTKALKKVTGISYSFFAVRPNSVAVIRTAPLNLNDLIKNKVSVPVIL